MKRYYICDVIGDGTWENPYRPAIADDAIGYVGDIKSDPQTGAPLLPWCLVLVAAPDHTKLSKPGRDALPDFPLDGKTNAINASAKAQMNSVFARRNITLDVNAKDGYRDVINGLGKIINPNFDSNNFDIAE